MKYLLFSLFQLLIFRTGQAQQLFISSGKLSFEKKINIQRTIAGLDLSEEAKDNMQKYNLSTWELYFDQSTSIYKQQKKAQENSNQFFGFSMENTNELYNDYSNSKRILKKNFFNESYLLNDTIPEIDWKIMHDVREIAGYECRKAIGKINDTVYVVAFYSDEILLRGGPEGFSGLPGMILGLAIPRYNTTWFATKVEPFFSTGSPPQKPKAKKTDTEKELKKIMEIYGRFEGNKQQSIEAIRKQIYGFLL